VEPQVSLDARALFEGDGGMIRERVYCRITARDFYARGGRRPYASVNFVTIYDGFTLDFWLAITPNKARGQWRRGTTIIAAGTAVLKPTDNAEVTMEFSGEIVAIARGAHAARPATKSATCRVETIMPIADNQISWLHWDTEVLTVSSSPCSYA
jgi:pullulanase/glycogen debranching enzyme